MPESQMDLFVDAQEDADVINTLEDIAKLEAALGLEIERLHRTIPSQAAVTGRGSQPRSKPMWWWRAQLVSWVHAPSTRRRHPEDLLRGWGFALKHFSDQQLRSYMANTRIGLRSSA